MAKIRQERAYREGAQELSYEHNIFKEVVRCLRGAVKKTVSCESLNSEERFKPKI